ncbi:MAG: hypothetical protein IKL55_05980 [Clostridia bacterium]|nr:hypothetical protein [Clostridia bacterium]
MTKHGENHEKCKLYRDFAYRALKMNSQKVPTESRMKVPLSVMFVLYNRDLFGYTTVNELVKTISDMADISENSARERVIGHHVTNLYSGLVYLIDRYARKNNEHYSHFWSSNNTNWRYEQLVFIENRLQKAMSALAEEEHVDMSMFRLFSEAGDVNDE